MTISVTHYADVRVTGDGVPQIAGTLVTRLHGFMVSRGVRVAVAFPKYKSGDHPRIGETIRFFGEHQVLNSLLDDLDGDERERWMCGRVKETPDYETMSAYLHRALPRRPGQKTRSTESAMRRRDHMLNEMQAWPFFFVRSRSGDMQFPFTVEKRMVKAESMNGDGDGLRTLPNAYGFSTSTRIVPVPEF